ncbi:hypothetical protein NEOKW01_0081 [Nematocida sp. AWRm80]|nr:hypothetical protein NEOKW01_0081 [Nematocida sp. AWRm80]
MSIRLGIFSKRVSIVIIITYIAVVLGSNQVPEEEQEPIDYSRTREKNIIYPMEYIAVSLRTEEESNSDTNNIQIEDMYYDYYNGYIPQGSKIENKYPSVFTREEPVEQVVLNKNNQRNEIMKEIEYHRIKIQEELENRNNQVYSQKNIHLPQYQLVPSEIEKYQYPREKGYLYNPNTQELHQNNRIEETIGPITPYYLGYSREDNQMTHRTNIQSIHLQLEEKKIEEEDTLNTYSSQDNSFDLKQLFIEKNNYIGIYLFIKRLIPKDIRQFECIIKQALKFHEKYKCKVSEIVYNDRIEYIVNKSIYIDIVGRRWIKQYPRVNEIYLDTENKIVFCLSYFLTDLLYLENDLGYSLVIFVRSSDKSRGFFYNKYKIIIKMLKNTYRKILIYFSSPLDDSYYFDKVNNELNYLRHPFVGDKDSYLIIDNARYKAYDKYILTEMDVIEITLNNNHEGLFLIPELSQLKRVKYLGIRMAKGLKKIFPKEFFLYNPNTTGIQVENIALITPNPSELAIGIESGEILRSATGILEITCDIWCTLGLASSTNALDNQYIVYAKEIIIHPCIISIHIHKGRVIDQYYPTVNMNRRKENKKMNYTVVVKDIFTFNRYIYINMEFMCLYIPASDWQYTLDLIRTIEIDRNIFPVLKNILLVSDAIEGYTCSYPRRISYNILNTPYISNYTIDKDTNKLVYNDTIANPSGYLPVEPNVSYVS